MKILSKTQLKYFKSFFLEKEKTILAHQIKEDLSLEGGDETDIVQGNIIVDMMEKLSSRDKLSLKKITKALKKIENKTFGICEECEEIIPEKRLMALPDCETCISCAEELEKTIK